MPAANTPFRVLIVRLGAMGDILHALPAITALRQAHPDWHLGWAVEPHWQALLTVPSSAAQPRTPAQPLVDQLHFVPAKAWARSPLHPATLRAIADTRRQLLAARYHLALDLQGAVRSALLARLARPGRIVGEASPREPLARLLFTERVPTTGTHVIEQAAEVTRALTSTPLPIALPLLPHDPQAEAWAAAHIPAGPFALLSPGAGWGAKRWPLARYAALARALAAEGCPVIFNASPAEAPEITPLARETGATVLVPALAELIALTRRAALAIAGDTGPLHLAAALGLPTVGIFGPTDPARNGPFHGRFTTLRHSESRRDHTRRAAPEAGLLTISPEQVLRAALDLLENGREDRPVEGAPPAQPGLGPDGAARARRSWTAEDRPASASTPPAETAPEGTSAFSGKQAPQPS